MAFWKILIADDEPSLRLLVSSTLEDERYEIFEARDGFETLAKVEQIRPDVLILDLMMPGLSGHDVIRRMKTMPSLSSTKIIVLSAKGQEQDVRQAIDAGVAHYLIKPFSPLQLLNVIEQVLDSSRQAR